MQLAKKHTLPAQRAGLLRAIAMSGLLLSSVGGCASDPGAVGSGSTAVPPNYRQRVAVKLREMTDLSDVKSPEISRPQVRFVGLLYGGTRPTVCVRLIKPNFVGVPTPHLYLFYFDNGQADGYQQGAYNAVSAAFVGCDPPLSPFPELLRSR